MRLDDGGLTLQVELIEREKLIQLEHRLLLQTLLLHLIEAIILVELLT